MATQITAEQAKAAFDQWVKALNLTPDQKAQFKQAVDTAIAKLNDMAAKGQKLDGPTVKTNLRAAVEKWLTPEQLAVWDKGFDTAKAALGL